MHSHGPQVALTELANKALQQTGGTERSVHVVG
jgi:hypothetical protein